MDELYWKTFNFFVRRVMASAFIVGGLVLCFENLPDMLPGGTVLVDGVPSSDLVFRGVATFFPLLVSYLGFLLYRVKPYFPQRKPDSSRKMRP